MRVVAAIAWADVLERVRRSSYLVVLGLVVWLGWLTHTGDVAVVLDHYQGRFNAAWAGGMMALIAGTFLNLAGFWMVRHAVDRDERSGVGPILATTPLARVAYTLGKALSHFLVLASMLVVLLLAAAVMLLAHGGPAALEPWPLVAPFVVVALPSLALTAALAILFETTPGLRTGFGNGIWLLVFTGLIMLSFESASPWLDPLGLRAITESMGEAARARFPSYVEGLSIGGGGPRPSAGDTFQWSGVRWTPTLLAARVLWLALAAGIAALAALPFHRFDPARGGERRASTPRRGSALRDSLTRAGRRARRFLPGGLVGGELRLLLAGAGPWWWLVAAGLAVAGLVAPVAQARAWVLPLTWLWPLARWSGLGGREAQFDTAGFVFPAPGARARQIGAQWVAGALLAGALAAPILLRLAAAEPAALAGAAAGALFVPALAIALGTWSGGSRLFEIVYVLLWYVGPMNRVAALDFLGGTPGSGPVAWLVATPLLMAVALVGRRITLAR